MPSSDDAPHTPARAGVAGTFFNGANAAEHGEFKLLPSTRVELGTEAPIGKVSAENFYLRMGGVITFPEAGEYSFLVEGASDDDTELFLAGKKVISAQGIPNVSAPSSSVSVKAGQKMAFRLEYRHRTEKGTLRLLWNRPGQDSPQSIPPQFLRDAWGRFITNEGMPADWWLQLTRMGKTMMLEGRAKEFPGSKH